MMQQELWKRDVDVARQSCRTLSTHPDKNTTWAASVAGRRASPPRSRASGVLSRRRSGPRSTT
jgi:hypothetical protein